jgi:hypothetical protein
VNGAAINMGVQVKEKIFPTNRNPKKAGVIETCITQNRL